MMLYQLNPLLFMPYVLITPILLTIYKVKCTLFHNGEVFFSLFFSLYCILFYNFVNKWKQVLIWISPKIA